jgi:predicted acetyltransferase
VTDTKAIPEIRIQPEDDGSSTRVDLLQEGKSVSRLWLTPFTIRVGEARVRMDGVGGVGTDEEWRGRGYSRRVIEAAIGHMESGAAALSMLYGIRDFYPKFGYATAGPDYLVVLRDIERDGALPPGWGVRPFRAEDIGAVRALYAAGAAATGSAVRPEGGDLASRLLKSEPRDKEPACRLVVGSDGTAHGYIWRASQCWYVRNALQPRFKQAIVLGEVIADGLGAADAVLAACRLWAKEQPAARKIKEVVLAFPPEGPLAAAAMRQDARFVQSYDACGGSMARVVSVPRLLEQLRPELAARVKAERSKFAGTLEIRTDIGTAALRIGPRSVRVTHAAAGNGPRLAVALPQSDLARLALGAFQPEDVLARLPEQPSAAAAELIQLLFPTRHPHMHLPDRY